MKLHELYETECLITEAELYEMARVKEANSGINTIMYASTKKAVRQRHGPRIKVSNIRNTFSADDNFAVTIDAEPRVVAGKAKLDELDDIIDWIKLNKVALLKYWNDGYDNDVDFYQDLRSI